MVYGDNLSDISVDDSVVDVLSMSISNVLVDGVRKLKHNYGGYGKVHVDEGMKSVPVVDDRDYSKNVCKNGGISMHFRLCASPDIEIHCNNSENLKWLVDFSDKIGDVVGDYNEEADKFT